MKIVKKNVYYCGFCNKRGLSGGHMRSHEAHCTANPGRVCRLCGGGSIEQVVADFKARFTLKEVRMDHEYEYDVEIMELRAFWTGEPVTLAAVKEAANDCPNCILAILRQVGFNRYYFPDF